MVEIEYRCVLESNVVLNSETATEGLASSLDYLPGACFRGIVAREYNAFRSQGLAQQVFHSGKIQFGDAHPEIDGRRSLRVPLAWHVPKGKGLSDGEVYISHVIPQTQPENYASMRLKQLRNGWFLEQNAVSVKKTLTLKSAFDAEKRRPAQSQMFAYEALQKGTAWRFTVRFDEQMGQNVIDRVSGLLVGNKQIGRSRSAQFGACSIERTGNTKSPVRPQRASAGLVVIYAESRLSFYDIYGQPTLTPTPTQLGISNARVRWDLSQIRSCRYSPWNGKRNCRDDERLCIEKGSVIVMDTKADMVVEQTEKGLGTFLSEGFGRVLINPVFLEADSNGQTNAGTQQCEMPIAKITNRIRGDLDSSILRWLEQQQAADASRGEMLKRSEHFRQQHRDAFKRISSSQWGLVRAEARTAADFGLFIESLCGDAGILTRGVTAPIWKNCLPLLRNELEQWDEGRFGANTGLRYTEHLASIMQASSGEDSESGE